MIDRLNEMKLAFPGQDIIGVPSDDALGPHVQVPGTDQNEALLKRRGYMYERSGKALCVFFPNESLMND